MKISEYIKKLQAVVDNNGDLEVVCFAEDDEDGFFYKVDYSGGILYFDDLSVEYPNQVDVDDSNLDDDLAKAFCIN